MKYILRDNDIPKLSSLSGSLEELRTKAVDYFGNKHTDEVNITSHYDTTDIKSLKLVVETENIKEEYTLCSL